MTAHVGITRGFIKIQISGPQLEDFRLRRFGVGPKNVHFWQNSQELLLPLPVLGPHLERRQQSGSGCELSNQTWVLFFVLFWFLTPRYGTSHGPVSSSP